MKKVGSNDITSKQLLFILVGSMIGVGGLSLPSDLVKTAGQGAWMSAVIGGIYPIYMVTVGSFLIKNYPDTNILKLSKRYLGAFLGTVLNIGYFLCFVFATTSIASGLSNLFVISLTAFLTAGRILSVVIFAAAYTAYKDLKIIGRVNELMFYFTLALSAFLLFGLMEGDYRNLLPVFDVSITKILVASKDSLFSYIGIEVLFLFYPYVTDKKKLIPNAFKSVLITIVIYVWFVIITIYFLGIDLVPKFTWPVTMVPKAVEIPVISNFRLLFMILWGIIIFKTVANCYYSATYILKDIIKKASKNIIYILLYISAVYLAFLFKDEVTRRTILNKALPAYLFFNVFYVTLVVLIAFLKRGKKHDFKEQ
jgi:spore germination protein